MTQTFNTPTASPGATAKAVRVATSPSTNPPARFALDLAERGSLSIADAAGVSIDCERGSVWITLDGEARDIVLAPGQRFTGEAHRRAFISALADSRIAVATPRPALTLRAEAQAARAASRWVRGLAPA